MDNVFRAGLQLFPKSMFEMSGTTFALVDRLRAFEEDQPGLLDQFDACQALHVTFGSVLARYGEALKKLSCRI